MAKKVRTFVVTRDLKKKEKKLDVVSVCRMMIVNLTQIKNENNINFYRHHGGDNY